MKCLNKKDDETAFDRLQQQHGHNPTAEEVTCFMTPDKEDSEWMRIGKCLEEIEKAKTKLCEDIQKKLKELRCKEYPNCIESLGSSPPCNDCEVINKAIKIVKDLVISE